MKTKEIISMYTGLFELRLKEFPAKAAFALSRNSRILQPIVEDYEKVRLQIIISNGGRPSETQQGVYELDTSDPEKYRQVTKELSDLENIDNPDVQLMKIHLSDLENMNLSISAIDAIYPMISEEE